MRGVNMTLKEFRKSRGWTLVQLADELGCSPSAISKYERNVESVPDSIVEKIVDKFDVTVDKQYNNLSIYKRRIKDLEDANQKLVMCGIRQEEILKNVLKELNDLTLVVNSQINKIQKLLKGSD